MARGYSQARSELTAQDLDDREAAAERGTGRISDRNRMRKDMTERFYKTAETIRAAYEIASEVHATQTRRDGAPYMQHVLEVADGTRSPKARMVALLHDTMEDGGITREQMVAKGIPADVITAVEALTRPPKSEQKMTYQEYIEQVVKPNELARQVKIADLKSNLKNNDNPGQVKRYERALKALLP